MKVASRISFLFILILSLSSQPIDLRNPTEQYDYVVITTSYFVDQFDEFIQHKENVKSLTCEVVSVDDIYEEFQGEHSAENEMIREFISYAGKNWLEPKPKYFFLAGDIDEVPNFEVVGNLTYDTVYTDYLYSVDVELNDEEKVDYFVGRISARNNEELGNYLLKVIEYELTPLAEWHNNILVAGYDGQTTSNIYQNFASQFSQDLYNYIRPDILLSPADYDRSSFMNSLVNGINIKGYSAVFLIGKSNFEQFGDPAVFDLENIDAISTNYSPLIVLMGKQIFSTQREVSLIDKTLFNKNGAIGGISPIGLHYISVNSRLSRILFDYLYGEVGISISEAVAKAFNDPEFSFNFPRKDLFGIFGDPSLAIKYDILASVEREETVNDFVLHQNYPNPFNPATRISFSLPESSLVELRVYDVIGREVATLFNSKAESGTHELTFNGESFSSGIYFYQFKAGNFTATRKMLLLK